MFSVFLFQQKNVRTSSLINCSWILMSILTLQLTISPNSRVHLEKLKEEIISNHELSLRQKNIIVLIRHFFFLEERKIRSKFKLYLKLKRTHSVIIISITLGMNELHVETRRIAWVRKQKHSIPLLWNYSHNYQLNWHRHRWLRWDQDNNNKSRNKEKKHIKTYKQLQSWNRTQS